MNTISERAPGKVNLSLDVTGRRSDGYHLLRMIMQTVDIYDTVTIRRMPGTEDIVTDSNSGAVPSGPANLVWKAADVMRRRFGLTEGLYIYIEKRIPVAAGMAGGSSDAAAVCRLMRALYEMEVTDEELQRLVLPLGADIPYCICGGTKLCEGIGEVMTCLPSPPPCSLIVVKPDIDVSTAWAYRAFDSIPENALRHPDIDAVICAIRRGDLDGMCRSMGNVLERQTGRVYPVIGEIEQFLLKRGACGSMMTGSGPTVFGVYRDDRKADAAFEELEAASVYRNCMKFRATFTSS